MNHIRLQHINGPSFCEVPSTLDKPPINNNWAIILINHLVKSLLNLTREQAYTQ